ncbi:hypothetical protein D9M70_451140 [compost metagenome]
MAAQAMTTFRSSRIGVNPRRTSSETVAQIKAPVASISPGRAKDARRSCAASPSSVPSGKAIASTMKSVPPTGASRRRHHLLAFSGQRLTSPPKGLPRCTPSQSIGSNRLNETATTRDSAIVTRSSNALWRKCNGGRVQVKRCVSCDRPKHRVRGFSCAACYG